MVCAKSNIDGSIECKSCTVKNQFSCKTDKTATETHHERGNYGGHLQEQNGSFQQLLPPLRYRTPDNPRSSNRAVWLPRSHSEIARIPKEMIVAFCYFEVCKARILVIFYTQRGNVRICITIIFARSKTKLTVDYSSQSLKVSPVLTNVVSNNISNTS